MSCLIGSRSPGAFWWGVSFILVILAPPLHAAGQSGKIASPERTFIGPDGNPLPFKTDAEIMEFMLTARVADETTIGTGINRPQKVTLEKDGVRANAIFREADRTERNAHVGGEFYRVFRDSYLFEPAAYQLALRLGITNIPPAVRRRIGGRDGSLQIWIEDLLNEEDKETFKPPSVAAWVRQLRDMILFDNLICNVDRNSGNILVGSNHTLVMVDHTRGFQEKTAVMDPKRLNLVNRETWEKFQNLTEQEIRDAVRPYLTPQEMSALVRRHQAILEHIEALIEERGEDAVVMP